MGYCIEQRNAKFTIKAKNMAGALAAIKALDPEAPGSHAGGSTSMGFSWVHTTEFRNAKTLDEAIKAWRWSVVHEDRVRRGVGGIYFKGDKLGNDKELFDAIAPYVESGSYIEMSGEDGAIWQWQFDGTRCTEVQAELDWERNRDIVETLLEHKEILPTLIGIHPALDSAIAKAGKKPQ